VSTLQRGPPRGAEARKRVRYVSVLRGIRHVSGHTVAPFEAALARAGIPRAPGVASPALKRALRYASYLGLVRNLGRGSAAYVVPLMGFQEAFTVPYCYFGELIPFVWDCFAPDYPLWDGFFERHRVRLAFFTARQSCEHFRRARPAMTSAWVPEATDASEFDPGRALASRRIDVLEFGRRYDAFHAAVAPDLVRAGRVHLYERVKGAVVFKARADFVRGLADARISVCFPSSLTHPARSGPVETATHRYFESMASGCLVVGRAPQELIDVFGFNPVIEAELDRAAAQLRALLEDLPAHQDRVARNLEAVRRVGVWDARVPLVLDALRANGYEVGAAPHARLQTS
jgi:hypothetical protein